MIPVAVGAAVSLGVELSSGGQPPAARTPGWSGHSSSGSKMPSSSRSAKNWKLMPSTPPTGRPGAVVEPADLIV